MTTESLFAQWLRREMVSRGYPLEGPRAGGITRLAADAGISQATMSRTVRGQQEPSLDTLRKLGDLFGIEIAQMMAHAGLAEYARAAPGSETTAEADLADRGSRFEALDGGKEDPRDYTEQVFYAEYEAGRRHFDHPPYGFQDEYEADVWAAEWTFKEFPETEFLGKYGIVKAHRDKVAQHRAQEAARRIREADRDRRRSNRA